MSNLYNETSPTNSNSNLYNEPSNENYRHAIYSSSNSSSNNEINSINKILKINKLIDNLEKITIYNNNIIIKKDLEKIIKESSNFDSFKDNYISYVNFNGNSKIKNNKNTRIINLLYKNDLTNNNVNLSIDLINKRMNKIKKYLLNNNNSLKIVHIYFLNDLIKNAKNYEEFKDKYIVLKNNVDTYYNSSSIIKQVLDDKEIIRLKNINEINLNNKNLINFFMKEIKELSNLIEKISDIFLKKEIFYKIIQESNSFNIFKEKIINNFHNFNKENNNFNYRMTHYSNPNNFDKSNKKTIKSPFKNPFKIIFDSYKKSRNSA